MQRTDVRSEERYESIIFSNRADSIKRGQALPFPRKSGEGVRPLRHGKVGKRVILRRFFSDSRNTHGLIVAGQWFTDLILCSFLTGVLLFYFNKWFLYKIIGSRGDVVFSIAYMSGPES